MITNLDPIALSIGNFGFPIVAYFLMWRLVNTTIKKNTDAINELKQELKIRRK